MPDERATEATDSTPATRVQAEPLDEVDLPFPLQEDEEVYAYLRRHWLSLYPRLLAYLVFAVVPPGVAFAIAERTDALDEDIVRLILVVASALWILFWVVRMLFTWYRYNNDIWIVTDQRLIDSKKSHPFDLHVASADLVDVVDTSISRSGPLQTAFNFGDVQCQTAGSSTNFRLGQIPEPARYQALVDRLRDVARREANG